MAILGQSGTLLMSDNLPPWDSNYNYDMFRALSNQILNSGSYGLGIKIFCTTETYGMSDVVFTISIPTDELLEILK